MGPENKITEEQSNELVEQVKTGLTTDTPETKSVIDQALTNASKEETVEDQVEKSAATFYHMHRNFRKIGYQLAERKKKSPIRVLEAFLFEPLHEVEVFGKEEQLLLDMARELMYHKNKIMEYGLEKIQKEKEENNEQK